MTPRHPPRALRDLTTPTRPRVRSSPRGGPARGLRPGVPNRSVRFASIRVPLPAARAASRDAAGRLNYRRWIRKGPRSWRMCHYHDAPGTQSPQRRIGSARRPVSPSAGRPGGHLLVWTYHRIVREPSASAAPTPEGGLPPGPVPDDWSGGGAGNDPAPPLAQGRSERKGVDRVGRSSPIQSSWSMATPVGSRRRPAPGMGAGPMSPCGPEDRGRDATGVSTRGASSSLERR